jgi:hypothetical protein
MMGIFSFTNESKRTTYEKIEGEGVLPNGNWKRSSQLLSVKGIQYRRDEVLKFTKLALTAHRNGNPFGLLVEREPLNPEDENALKIIGWCGGKSIHVGYVDRVEAARHSERFPNVFLAAEFYSLYQSASNFVDIRFFLSIPYGTTPKSSGRVQTLLECVKDELVVLVYLAAADGKRGRFENDILNKYVEVRANDYSVPLLEEDVVDIKNWLKSQNPTLEEMASSVDKLSDSNRLPASELWEMAEIIVGIDGKISKHEMRAAIELSEQMKLSFNFDPLS